MLGRLWRNRHYRYGVAAQFFSVGAQVCTWTFTMQYAQDVVGVSTGSSGWYLQASLLVFLVARFLMTWLLGIFRPTLLLFLMGSLGVTFAVVSQNIVGLLAVVAISLSPAAHVPDDLRRRAAGARRGHEVRGRRPRHGDPGRGAPDAGPRSGHGLGRRGGGLRRAAVCLAFVTAYALFDLRAHPEGGALVAEGAH